MVNKEAASAVLAPAAKRGAGLRNNWLLGVALCPSHNSGWWPLSHRLGALIVSAQGNKNKMEYKIYG